MFYGVVLSLPKDRQLHIIEAAKSIVSNINCYYIIFIIIIIKPSIQGAYSNSLISFSAYINGKWLLKSRTHKNFM